MLMDPLSRPALLTTLIVLGLPAPAPAASPIQPTGTISHKVVYPSALDAGPVAAPVTASAMPTVTASPMPMADLSHMPASLLRQHNQRPAWLGPSGVSASGEEAQPGGVTVEAHGTGDVIAPYTAAGAYAQFWGPVPNLAALPVASYPWRAAGRITFRDNRHGLNGGCSGSMILPGVLVTAAHCVFEYGKAGAGWYTDILYSPGFADKAVLGTWTTSTVWIPTVYYDGTDTCESAVCNNDIAVMAMNRNAAGKLPGTVTSWFGYSWDGYGFVDSYGDALLAHVTQLGYPLAFDGGLRMQRVDTVAEFWNPSPGLYNILMSGPLTGGASGGPLLVNFGTRPVVNGKVATLGADSRSNVVMGVTSWHADEIGNMTTGASWFGKNGQFPVSYKDSHGVFRGAGNIGALVASACSGAFDAC